jgi:hypothetical protein
MYWRPAKPTSTAKTQKLSVLREKQGEKQRFLFCPKQQNF